MPGDGMGGSRRSATIYAVAERAGVSIATVSRVLHGHGAASAGSRARVLKAVDELDYVPRHSARSLAVGRYGAYGLVLGDLTGSYFPQLALGFEAEAARDACSVVLQLADQRSDPMAALRGLLSRVDALAIGPSALPDADVARLARRVPTVVLGRAAVDGCDVVQSESAGSARRLAQHLVEHGRHRLLFVGDVDGSWDAQERFAGFAAGCADAGVTPLPPLQSAQTEAAGVHVADAIATDPRSVDAVVCVNDELALAIAHRLPRHGLRVPDDIAVTGWDDVPAARYLTPGLTTVRQPVFDLGVVGGAVLRRRAADPDGERTTTVLPTELVIRRSCGCPDLEEAS